MPEATVPQSLIWDGCVAAKWCEFAPDQVWAQGHSPAITQSSGHPGQMIARLAQSDNHTDTVHHEVCYYKGRSSGYITS